MQNQPFDPASLKPVFSGAQRQARYSRLLGLLLWICLLLVLLGIGATS